MSDIGDVRWDEQITSCQYIRFPMGDRTCLDQECDDIHNNREHIEKRLVVAESAVNLNVSTPSMIPRLMPEHSLDGARVRAE